jgi:hypothetical protein
VWEQAAEVLVCWGSNAEAKNWRTYCPLGIPQTNIPPVRADEEAKDGLVTIINGTIRKFLPIAVNTEGIGYPPYTYFTHVSRVNVPLSEKIIPRYSTFFYFVITVREAGAAARDLTKKRFACSSFLFKFDAFYVIVGVMYVSEGISSLSWLWPLR